MALPLAPVAIVALRYGAVAVAAYAFTRQIERGRRDQRAEDTLDAVDDGLSLRRQNDQVNATGRYRRIFYLGQGGPGYQVDVASILRIRITRVKR